jgi:hypothetical protein
MDFIYDGEALVKGKVEFRSDDFHLKLPTFQAHSDSEKNIIYGLNLKEEFIEGDFSIEARDLSFSASKILTSNNLLYRFEGFTKEIAVGTLVLKSFSAIQLNESGLFSASGVTLFSLGSQLYSCSQGCSLNFENGNLVKIEGKVANDYFTFSVLEIKNGDLNKVSLDSSLEINLQAGKKRFSRSIQLMSFEGKTAWAKFYLPESKKDDIVLSFKNKVINLGRCQDDRCLVNLKFENSELVEALR